VREIREAFQVLDRDNDGLVDKDDVIDVLTTLGRKKYIHLFLKVT
jgi:Ca2+-binding EF-hand superfamily protein